MIGKKINIKLIKIISAVMLLVPGSALAQSGWNISDLSGYGLPEGSIYNIIIGIMEWLLAILGIAGIIGFAISGLLYLTSAGNEDQMKTAKRAMLYSIAGVLVGLSGYVIINAIQTMLSEGNRF